MVTRSSGKTKDHGRKKAKLAKDLTVDDVTTWIASDRVTNNELVEINHHLAEKLNANLGCVLNR